MPPLLPASSKTNEKKTITLVISPLISLMQDQTRQLLQLGIPATFLGSAQPDASCWQRVEAGEYSVVYMSPEFATMKWPAVVGLRDRLALLAVDEAHCVSSWGHDFRPEYREVAHLMVDIPEVPKLALTATCTMRVQRDLCELFGVADDSGLVLRDANVIPRNLRLVVSDRTTKEHDLTKILALECPGQAAEQRRLRSVDNSNITPYSSTLIYVPTKAMADELAEWLAQRGVRCGAYHAGLPLEDREEAHSRFFDGSLQLLCCTVAYGMGISKPDIRRIIHYGSPFTLENYVQQVGRAGRDGDLAECVCFASENDEGRSRQILLRGAQKAGAPDFYMEELMRMTSHLTTFLRSSGCRLTEATRYFNLGAPEHTAELASACGLCDRCDLAHAPDMADFCGASRTVDLTDEARFFIAVVDYVHQDMRAPPGYSTPCLVAVGSQAKQAKRFQQSEFHGKGKERGGQTFWRELARQLVGDGYLTEFLQTFTNSSQRYAAIQISSKGRMCLENANWQFQRECDEVSWRLLQPPGARKKPGHKTLQKHERFNPPKISAELLGYSVR